MPGKARLRTRRYYSSEMVSRVGLFFAKKDKKLLLHENCGTCKFVFCKE